MSIGSFNKSSSLVAKSHIFLSDKNSAISSGAILSLSPLLPLFSNIAFPSTSISITFVPQLLTFNRYLKLKFKEFEI